ncbi:hypothetical protein D7252_13925 [Microbacterium sp. CGR2]|nr:hypothetical protein D7252_13925 [Microbacterium sp. CGR2]
METTIIIRRSGPPVRDPATGTMIPSITTIYTGPARVRFPTGQPRDVDQSGQRVTEQSPTVWVPVHASGIRPDDVGEVTANPHAPEDVGLKFRVAGVHAQTHSTSRRLPVEVLTYA